MTNDEKTVRVCAECEEPTEELTYQCGNGWDGVTRCPGCGALEPDTKEVDIKELER